MRYAVKLTHDNGVYVATCRDLPAFNSVGNSVEETLSESVDAVALALQGYIDERQPIPRATEKRRGEHYVNLPALDVAKIGLYEAMYDRGLRKANLVRLLGMHGPQVDRLLSLAHKSKLEQVEGALAKLGYRVNVSVEPFNRRRAA